MMNGRLTFHPRSPNEWIGSNKMIIGSLTRVVPAEEEN